MKKYDINEFFKIGIIILILFNASSCGQKGPLYHPDENSNYFLDYQIFA
jgi:predicted small lipoprotein YifL